MAPPVHQKSAFIPVNTWWEDELELEEGEGLICKRKRAKFSDSTMPQKKGIEIAVAEKVKEATAAPPLGVSVVKYETEGAIDHVDLSGDRANGYNKEHANGSTCTSKEPARLRLHEICSAAHWKEPLYNFEEQGPSHAKLFTCKVTIHVETWTNTVLECMSEPKRQKKAAQEHAAQAALWYLNIFGHSKYL
ncbi:hypothetical protein GUJ93_ZPchr0002g23521 [Zizania palustris]|uniref:DRBM domain-containing protein n=1 Tax=Zizania palustris TaxID=103762 RepID=A0A8J5RUI3_ZIZPA|nr:hypothetical protein GUJ93_ZPchr0002g23521 [Zizania palustris]